MSREELWNLAELAEKRKDSRTAREWVLALPVELNTGQRAELAREFAKSLVVRYGVAVDVCIHAPGRDGDQRNHHAHLLTTTRRLGLEGLAERAEIELRDAKLKEMGLPTGRQQIELIREEWAVMANSALEQAGHEARIDHRTLKAQGVQRAPTVHMGRAATAMERRGEKSRQGEKNRAVAVLNTESQYVSLPSVVLDPHWVWERVVAFEHAQAKAEQEAKEKSARELEEQERQGKARKQAEAEREQLFHQRANAVEQERAAPYSSSDYLPDKSLQQQYLRLAVITKRLNERWSEEHDHAIALKMLSYGYTREQVQEALHTASPVQAYRDDSNYGSKIIAKVERDPQLPEMKKDFEAERAAKKEQEQEPQRQTTRSRGPRMGM